MIRPLIMLVLLAASPLLLAQPLYKWVEDDGSITFSVEPPPAGVSFETVEAEKSQSANITPSARQTDEAPDLAKALAGQSSETLTPAAPSAPAQNSTQNNLPAASANASTAPYTGDDQPDARQLNGRLSDRSAAAVDSKSRKQHQCEDLQKRIVSLERRLRQSLSDEDMDNTVVYMAKYQLSYNQHCVQ